MITALKSRGRLFIAIAMICAVALSLSLPLSAQNSQVVQGQVLDAQKKPIAGATIQVKQTNISTITDELGKFSLRVPGGKSVIIVSYVGKSSQEITVGNQKNLGITLADVSAEMNEVVVVGYGRQRKASVVGAISQVSGQVLERTGGVSNLGMTLTGNLPG